EKMMMGEEVSTSEYLSLDDTEVIFYMKQWAREPDAILSDLCRRFINRKLFKATDLNNLSSEQLDAIVGLARASFDRAGFDPDYYLRLDRAGDVPYGYYSTADIASGRWVYAENGAGGISEISEISGVVAAMRRYHIDRICYPEEMSDSIAAAIAQGSA